MYENSRDVKIIADKIIEIIPDDQSELINKLETQLWIMNGQTKKIDIFNDSYDAYCNLVLNQLK
jgi:hypothetical protein